MDDCQMPGCHCHEANIRLAGKRYCSEACAQASSDGDCHCGHLDCRGHA